MLGSTVVDLSLSFLLQAPVSRTPLAMKGSFAFIVVCLAGVAFSVAQQGASAAALHALKTHKYRLYGTHKPPWIPSSKSPPRCLPCGNTLDSHDNQSDSFRLHIGRDCSDCERDSITKPEIHTDRTSISPNYSATEPIDALNKVGMLKGTSSKVYPCMV